MSTLTNFVGQTTGLPWDISQNGTHEVIDRVIDRVQNTAANATIVALPIVVTGAGTCLKTGINLSLPALSPFTTPLINAGTAASVAFCATPPAHELVHTFVQEIGNVAKAAVHSSIDNSFGLGNRNIRNI